MTRFACLAFAAMFALGGCHKDKVAQQDAETLPAPDAGKGSVTGMPDKPGPGAIGTPAPELPAPSSIANAADAALAPDQAQGIAVGEPNPFAPPAGNAIEPGPSDALQLVRDYYAAIAAHDYGRAYKLWSENGAASGQSPQQFANGFADTTDVRVQVGDPVVDGASAEDRAWRINSAKLRETAP